MSILMSIFIAFLVSHFLSLFLHLTAVLGCILLKWLFGITSLEWLERVERHLGKFMIYVFIIISLGLILSGEIVMSGHISLGNGRELTF